MNTRGGPEGGPASGPSAAVPNPLAHVFASPAFVDTLRATPTLTLAPGETLLRQGEPSDAAYFLASGSVLVLADTPYGQVPLSTLSAPRLIGEIGVLADLPRTASITATTAAVLHRIERPLLLELGHRLPALLSSIIAQMGRQLDSVNKTVGLYTNALAALERREFDARILEDLKNPPPQLAEFAATFRRFAQQITDKRRHEDEMASAAVIQQSLLPRAALVQELAETLDLAVYMRAARDVGGDFYDVMRLDENRIAVAIGDICGKGLPASLFMAIVVTVLRTAAHEHNDAAAAIARTNAILCRDNAANLFATVFFAIVDLATGRVDYCNCGHNPPLVLSATGDVRLLPATGLPLALFDDRSPAGRTLQLMPGDALVLYTDGITEAHDAAGAEFGDERLLGVVRAASGEAADRMIASLIAEVDAFAGTAEQADDMTSVVVRLGPRGYRG